MNTPPPKPPPFEVKLCRECGADNPLTAHFCWLCGGQLKDAQVVVPAEAIPDRSYGISEMVFAALTIGALALTVMLVLGLGLDGAGASIVLVLILGPSLAAIAIQTAFRMSAGKQFSWLNTFLTVVVSITLSIGAAVVLAVFIVLSILAAIAAACSSMLSQCGATN